MYNYALTRVEYDMEVYRFYRGFFEKLDGVPKYVYSSDKKTRFLVSRVNIFKTKLKDTSNISILWFVNGEYSSPVSNNDFDIYMFAHSLQTYDKKDERVYYYNPVETVSTAKFVFEFVADVLFKVCLLDKDKFSRQEILEKLLEYNIFSDITCDLNTWVKEYEPIKLCEARKLIRNLKKACIKEVFEYLDFSEYEVKLN